MTLSMTGFARGERSGPWGRLSCELRSVNHRYLDIQFKLPEELRAQEPELRLAAAQAASRGKLDCSIRLQRDAGTDCSALEVDEARLAAVRAALDQLAMVMPTLAPDPLAVLQFPGVLRQASSDALALSEACSALFAEVLAAFTASRASEGAKLRSYLLDRAEQVQRWAAQVRERFPQFRAAWLERLRARAAELGVELEPGRVEQELVLLLQRGDVEEELSRLDAHLGEIRKALSRPEPVGRRLDFLIQELNREANTLSSKSQDSELSRLAVEMKVAIEQMREQVQNIE